MHMQPVFKIKGRKEQGAGHMAGNVKEEHRVMGKERRHIKRYKARLVGGEVSEDLFERGLCLPSGTLMSAD